MTKLHHLTVGCDIGSTSMNIVICDAKGTLIAEAPYVRHFGRTVELLARELGRLELQYGAGAIERVVFTGTHGDTFARELQTFFEIETTAQAIGLHRVMPAARTVVAIGGHDSALFMVEPSGDGFALRDFKLNEACAAGTGSFIDQQAERIYSDLPQFADIKDPQARIDAILERFVAEGAKSDCPANVACRCTVFTKSDMIHLQNKGIPIRHIIAGLHDGVAKNFKSTLINNREIQGPVVLIGGYASNRLAAPSFAKILGMPVTVPPHHTNLGALGVALAAIRAGKGRAVRANEITALKSSAAFAAATTEPLAFKLSQFNDAGQVPGLPGGTHKLPAFLGFDIGSTTTKLVVVTPAGDVLYKRYIPTEGQPVVAIKKALRNLRETVDDKRIEVQGVGTTGSGREVANLFVGADDVVNEVTAHALGTTFFKPEVDTIFELGGQDAKYTLLKDGFVVDFRMNKVCAAGTGSFLEETAHKLGIAIDKEYEGLAMSSKAPLKLAERCTVFMEADLMSHLQMGAATPELLAGLAQAVVHNYLNRVVQDGKIGNCISFQGGPSLNRAVVAAFERITGRPIATLPHREVMGAIGAALHARDEMEKRRAAGEKVTTRFRGFDIVDAPFIHKEEVCHRNPGCHNLCKLQIYQVAGDEAIYGGECGMYESRQGVAKRTPNFHRIRQNIFAKALGTKARLLEDDGQNPQMRRGAYVPPAGERPTIGFPRSLSNFQLGVFWTHLLDGLGFDVVMSPETNNPIADAGIAAMTCETCFPIKISHGHAAWLARRCDYLFLPMMIEMAADPGKRGYYCPYLEANYHMLKAALELDERRVLHPAVYLKLGRDGLRDAFAEEMTRLGLPFARDRFASAWDAAQKAQDEFNAEIKKVGRATLASLGDRRAVVVVGRPYACYDGRTNLNLFATFSRLGAMAIPMEFLDLDDVEIGTDYPNMYWGFGEQILRAGRAINRDPRLFGLYLTSFSCGPDSFILHFFNHEMNRTGRPYLELELDEHSAGAGVETRLLAFLDVIANQRDVRTLTPDKTVHIVPHKATAPLKERRLFLPFMAEGARLLAAAFEGVGHRAEVMPTYTAAGLEFGKRHTSGKECFPCTVTTGDMFETLTALKGEKVDIENEVAFFMPETEGPCRFGQYNRLHRILLDRLGFDSVPILSPSSEDSYRCNGFFTTDEASEFRKLAWQAVVYGDILEKLLWRVRPYETTPGETDQVFARAMNDAVAAIKGGGGFKLLKAARRAARAFAGIVRNDAKRRPRIGIVGEIYVRTHKGSNQDLVRNLEQLGLETFTSSVSEWIEYTTHTGIEDSMSLARRGDWKGYLEAGKFFLTGKYQRAVAWGLARPFGSLLEDSLDHATEHILAETAGIFSNHINGEAILSIGGAIVFAKSGFNGVINAMPFTCMPSTIATAVLKGQMRRLKVPYIDMVYDGTILPNRATNLATFAWQAQQHHAG